MKKAMAVIAVILVGLLNGCAEKEEIQLPHKHWQTEQYRRVSNEYEEDYGNYVLVELEAQKGEKRVIFSPRDGRPLTFLKRIDEENAWRVLPNQVRYPGTDELLDVRVVYLMSGKKDIDHAHRQW